MTDDETAHEQVVLLETTDAMELSLVRGLLDGAEINYVVRGEHHHGVEHGMFGNPAFAPQVLVSRGEFERARALLAAKPVSTLEAICTVHEKPSTMVCGQCAAQLCDACKVTRGPPILCEDCGNGVPQQRQPSLLGTDTAKKTVASMMLAPLVLAGVALIIALLMRFFR